MTAAILWSGGKDSVYALHKARESGVNVKYAITGFFSDMTIPPTEEAIKEQCRLLDLESIIVHCDIITFHTAIKEVVPDDVDSLVYGEGQTTNVIMWFQEFCADNNYKPILPAFKKSIHGVITEYFNLGYKAIITRLPNNDLHYGGKEFDKKIYLRNKDPFKNPFGVASGLQTFVVDGPLFKEPMQYIFENKFRGRVKTIEQI